MPASVVVGLRLSFVMIAPPLCLRVGVETRSKSSFLESHSGVGRNEVLLRIIAQFEGDMMSVVPPPGLAAIWDGCGSDHSAGAVARGATSIPSSASNFMALWIKAA